MAIVVSPPAEVTILNVGWSVYEALLDESTDDRHSRLAFDGELLEIMSPSGKHERYIRLLEVLVHEVCREWGIDLVSFGSVTLKAKPRGAEADASFYVGERAARMRARDEVVLGTDPPPNIIVEVDISRERIDKQRLYAALGVPEFWRYDGARLAAYDLRTADFPEIARSAQLAGLPLAELDRFLERRRDVNHADLTAEWQRWLRDNRPT